MADDSIRRDEGDAPSHPLGSDVADLEHFFRTGDEGTYDGGPSASLLPVYSELEEETDPACVEAIAQRLERRARYQQLVTRLMTVLGVAALLALTLRATAIGATDPEPQPGARPADTRLALAPQVAPEPAPASAPEPAPTPESVSAPESAPPPVEARRAPAPAGRPRSSVRASARVVAPSPPVFAPRAPSLPRASTQFPSAGSSHAPPTANFPD